MLRRELGVCVCRGHRPRGFSHPDWAVYLTPSSPRSGLRPLLPWAEARSAAKARNLTPLAGGSGTVKK